MRMLKVAVLLAGCVAGLTAQGVAPLEASLRRGAGEALFYVDQPAYVAVFEVIPGSGVQQLFPRSSFEAREQVQRGEYLLSRPFRSQYGYYGWNNSMPYARPVFMLDGSGQIRGYYYTTGWTGNRDIGQRRTLLLVAARKPLRQVASPDAARHWLQQAVGFRAIANSVYAPESMLNDIVAAVLPMGATVDDVVVDVLELEVEYYQDRMWAGRSMVFQCPAGTFATSAEFYFATGVFYCPPVQQRGSVTPTPTTPTPGDTVIVETLNPTARRVPPKTDVEDESVRPFRRGTTPTEPNPMGEEGYRSLRRGVTPTPAQVEAPAVEGFRSFRRGGVPTEEAQRATIARVAPTPVDWATGAGNPAATAWVPPSPTLNPTVSGYGVRRYEPDGTREGYTRRTTYSTGTGNSSATYSPPRQPTSVSMPSNEGVGAARAVPSTSTEGVSLRTPATTTVAPSSARPVVPPQ